MRRSIALVLVLACLCFEPVVSRPRHPGTKAGSEVKERLAKIGKRADKFTASLAEAHAHHEKHHHRSLEEEADSGIDALAMATEKEKNAGKDSDDIFGTSDEEEAKEAASNKKKMYIFLLLCLVVICILGVVAYYINTTKVAYTNEQSNQTDTVSPASYFGVNAASLKPINILVGMGSGLVFGFIDNAGLFFGMEYLDPFFSTLKYGDEEKVVSGYGNTFSDCIGAFLGTFAGSIVKDLAVKHAGYVESEEYPIWSEAVGITLGCIIGVAIPRMILGDPAVTRLNKAKAEALASGVTQAQIDEVMKEFDRLDKELSPDKPGQVSVGSGTAFDLFTGKNLALRFGADFDGHILDQLLPVFERDAISVSAVFPDQPSAPFRKQRCGLVYDLDENTAMSAGVPKISTPNHLSSALQAADKTRGIPKAQGYRNVGHQGHDKVNFDLYQMCSQWRYALDYFEGLLYTVAQEHPDGLNGLLPDACHKEKTAKDIVDILRVAFKINDAAGSSTNDKCKEIIDNDLRAEVIVDEQRQAFEKTIGQRVQDRTASSSCRIDAGQRFMQEVLKIADNAGRAVWQARFGAKISWEALPVVTQMWFATLVKHAAPARVAKSTASLDQIRDTTTMLNYIKEQYRASETRGEKKFNEIALFQPKAMGCFYLQVEGEAQIKALGYEWEKDAYDYANLKNTCGFTVEKCGAIYEYRNWNNATAANPAELVLVAGNAHARTLQEVTDRAMAAPATAIAPSTEGLKPTVSTAVPTTTDAPATELSDDDLSEAVTAAQTVQ